MKLYLEALLAPHLKIPKKELAAFRLAHLKKTEWQQAGSRIQILQAGLDKILEKLAAEGLDCSCCLDVPETVTTAPLELVITRVFPNPNLLQCLKPAEGDTPAQTVQVRVSNNRNFRPRMTVRARPDPNFPHLYRLEGRCPRFPGRW